PEPGTQAEDRAVQRAVLGTEHVQRLLGVDEVDQLLRVAAQLDGHGYGAGGERVEELVAVAQLDVLVPAHPLLAGQPEPPLADELHPVTAEPDLVDAVARGGPN